MVIPVVLSNALTGAAAAAHDGTGASRSNAVLPPDAAAPPERPSRHDMDAASAIETADAVNAALRPFGLEFEIDSTIDRVITRVIDRESGDPIRQIPAEEIVAMLRQLESHAAPSRRGVLVQTQA